MALEKTSSANLRAKYKKVMEISLILSISFLIAAFKYFPKLEPGQTLKEYPPDIIKFVDIQQTRQEEKPVLPPRLNLTIIDHDIIDIELPPTEINHSSVIGPPPVIKSEDQFVVPEPFLDIAEIMPEPVGGMGTILNKITYPEIARSLGIQGKVYVLAYIDEQGDVFKSEIIKGVGAGLDEEALAAVQSTKFNPGKQRGKAVKVKVVIPVVFKLK